MTTATISVNHGGTRRHAGHRLDTLTTRERCVLAHMAKGESNFGISRSMYLSAKTVEAHIGAIFCKLGLYPEDGNRRVLAVLAWVAENSGEVMGSKSVLGSMARDGR